MYKKVSEIDIIKSTRKKIDAYKKIGSDDLITEAEKSYVYEQYDLAYEICLLILSDPDKYSQKVIIRAYEIKALVCYYHAGEITCREIDVEDETYVVLSHLDDKHWDIYDARYALGKMYAERGQYEKAMRSFTYWMKERDNKSGLKAFVEMFKREQYDTDKQHAMLFSAYFTYYIKYDVKDLLLRTAKYAEEYFPQYIYDSICEKLDLPTKQVSRIHYSDDDFALPYSMRCFDCAEYIRYYARNTSNPSLAGCMQYLSKRDIQADILDKTSRARKKALEDCLLRSHIRNENTKIELMRREYEENERRSRKMLEEMDRYNRQMDHYQKESLKNQEQSLRNQRAIKNAVDRVDSELSSLRWRL